MILKTIVRLLGIIAMGLMMGSSINYAVKGYGLLGASGSWARLIAQSIASSSSSSSSSSDKVDCSNYDLTKYTCRATEEWKTESVDVSISGNGSGSLSWGAQNIGVSGAGGRDKVTIVIKTPSCVSNDKNICAKSFVTNNKPIFSTTGATLQVR